MKNYSFLGYFYSFINFESFTISISKKHKKIIFSKLALNYFKTVQNNDFISTIIFCYL